MSAEILDPEINRSFSPNSWPQARFLLSDAPDLLYSGHLGSSKTRSLCEKADMRCWSFPGARVALGRRYRNHLGKSTIPELRDKVVGPGHWSWGWNVSSDGGSTLRYPNGSELWLLGFDNPQRLLSAEVDMVLIEQAEELTDEMWDAAAGRLRRRTLRVRPDGSTERAPYQIAGVCNPDSPQHFLFKRFRPDRGSHIQWSAEDVLLPNGVVVPRGRALAECVVAGHTDNMENLDPAYLARLQRYRGRYYERMVLGLWVVFEGMVYDCFDENIHRVRRPTAWAEWGGYPPPSWERVRSFDFGFHPDPFVCQWWARSPVGAWFLYREIYMTRRIVADHSRRIVAAEERELAALNKRLAAEPDGKPLDYLPVVGSFGDHDSEGRATIEQETAGQVVVERANKDVNAGIQTCYEMLSPVEVPGGRPRARMYLVTDALMELDQERADAGLPTCTADEFLAYRYPRVADRDKPSKEGPVDQHNHGMDAMRYAFHTLKMRSHWL